MPPPRTGHVFCCRLHRSTEGAVADRYDQLAGVNREAGRGSKVKIGSEISERIRTAVWALVLHRIRASGQPKHLPSRTGGGRGSRHKRRWLSVSENAKSWREINMNRLPHRSLLLASLLGRRLGVELSRYERGVLCRASTHLAGVTDGAGACATPRFCADCRPEASPGGLLTPRCR